MRNATALARVVRPFLLALILLSALAVQGFAAEQSPPPEALKLLLSKDLNVRAQAVGLLTKDTSEKSEQLLHALMEGKLFVRKKGKVLVFGDKKGRKYNITNALTGEDLGTVKKRKLSKVGVNNALRKQIRGALAQRDLLSDDVALRRSASENLISRLEQIEADSLAELLAQEKDAAVKDNLQAALAVKTLQTAQGKKAMDAVKLLEGNMNPAVRNALTQLKDRAKDPGLKNRITKALIAIESKAKFFSFLETLFFGASLGSVLVLAAIGLAITFGVMGVINMAHGELIMIGAYTTYVIQQAMPEHIEISLFVAIPAAFLVSAVVGVVIERCIIRFLYGRPLETLLATFGVSLVLQQAVRSIFSPLNRSVSTPQWMSGALEINPVLALTWNRLYIIIFCLMAFAALFLVLRKTRLGLEVRAVSQNRGMARAMGTRAALVDAMTFGLGSGIAGIAGVALSQLTNVGPNLGQAYIIDSFMVVVFGGVGNLWGTLLAGLSLGVANKVLEPISGAVLAKILVLVFIILFIQKRPTGLFPQRGRAVED